MTGIGRSADWWSIERPSTMWVRLRSSLPGEAIRSSTWNSSVASHGISSSSPRIASIAQGERPPLIASANGPRSADRRGAGRGDQLGRAPRRRLLVGDDLEPRGAIAAA